MPENRRRPYSQMFWRRLESVSAVVIAFAQLLPIWLVARLPTQDGPVHIYIAHALNKIAENPVSRLSEYFTPNWHGQPNLFVYAALTEILKVLPPDAAEKTLVSIFLLALPAAMAICARTLAGNPARAALLAIPAGLSYLLLMGFYNYNFGVILFLLGIIIWLQAIKRPTLTRLVALLVITIAAFYCHIFAAVCLVIVIAVATTWKSLVEAWESGLRGPTKIVPRIIKDGWPIAVSTMPVVVLILDFTLDGQGLSDATGYQLLTRVSLLGSFSIVTAISKADISIAAGFMIIATTCGYQAIRFHRIRRLPAASTPIAVAAISLLIVYFILPRQISGGSLVMERLLTFLYLTYAIWLSTVPASARFARNATVGLIVFAVALPVQRTWQFMTLDEELQSLYSLAPHIETGGTLLAVAIDSKDRPGYTPFTHYRLKPFLHAAHRISVDRELVDLHVIQANSSLMPLRYKDSKNPFWGLPMDRNLPRTNAYWRYFTNILEAPAPDIDFLEYEEKTGAIVDYLIIWGPYDEVRNMPDVQGFLGRVEAQFNLVHAANDYFRLYRHKPIMQPKSGGRE